jgi:hypothetical protein
MKKYLPLVFFLLFVILTVPAITQAGLVPCNGPDCSIGSFFEMLMRIYNFIVYWIATPLAVVALTVGGIFMTMGAANPNMFQRGKQIVWLAIIGLVLVWCSWLIIDFVITTLGGRPGSWSSV